MTYWLFRELALCAPFTTGSSGSRQARLGREQWLAVHGCGGVGLSAIMIARAVGARVIAIDISDAKLEFARSIGAAACITAVGSTDVVDAIWEISQGGAHVSIDALGSPATFYHSIAGLRKRGRHVQVGLLSPDQRNARAPTGFIVANELEILGSHGMQAHRYPQMLDMIEAGDLQPEKLIGSTIKLVQAAAVLNAMDQFEEQGVTVIDQFD